MATATRFNTPGWVSEPITIGRLLVPVLLVILWQALSVAVGTQLLPGPVDTVAMIERGIESGWIVGNFRDTMWTLFLGFVIAAVSGTVLGLVIGLNDVIYDVLEIYVLGIYSIPKVILYPLFLFAFGITINTKIAFGLVHGFFPMLLITMSAVRGIDDIYLKVASSLRLNRWQRFRHVMFPVILVQLVVGLRLAFSLTFIGVILAELFATESGLGLVLQHAMANFETGRIMAVVVILMIVAFIGNILFYGIQKWLENRWNMTVDSTGV